MRGSQSDGASPWWGDTGEACNMWAWFVGGIDDDCTYRAARWRGWYMLMRGGVVPLMS
jgi:hypothetical protein